MSPWPLIIEPHRQPDDCPQQHLMGVDLLLALVQRAPPGGGQLRTGAPQGKGIVRYKGTECHSWKKVPTGSVTQGKRV